MEKFTYKIRTADGRQAKGKIEARDQKSAIELLRQRKYFVVELRPDKDGGEFVVLKFLNRIKFDQVVNFTRQLSTMVTAGLGLTDALSILEVQSEKSMSAVVSQIVQDVEGGTTLAAAMEKHPKVFSKVYVALVKVGETAGVLDTVLKRLADTMESQREFRSKVKGAMIYPIIVLVAMALVGTVMMIFVIPQMLSMYKDFGATLPLPTQIMIAISGFFTQFWWLMGAIIAGLTFAFSAWTRTAAGRWQFDLIMLRVPILGPLRTEIVLTEFSRTMSLLVHAGISVLDGLLIVEEALGSAVFEHGVAAAAQAVEKGYPLATSLAQDQHFPPIVAQMISVGEETGKLDEVLDKLSSYFAVESEQKVKALTTAIEPLIMVVLGIGVGFLVISVILPIYNLTNQF